MEKLVESPFSRKSETQRSLKISEGVIGSLTQQLNEAKPTGRASTATRKMSSARVVCSLRKELNLRKEKARKAQESQESP